MATRRRRKSRRRADRTTDLATERSLFDRGILHAVLRERAAASEARTRSAVWQAAIDDVLDAITGRLDRLKSRGLGDERRNPWKTAIYAETMRRVAKILADTERVFRQEVAASMLEFGRAEVAWQAKSIEDTLRISLTRPPVNIARAAMTQTPVDGLALEDWTEGLRKRTEARIREVLNRGILRGEATPTMARDVAKIADVTRKHAEGVTRTALTHAAMAGRETLFQANADVIIGVVWVSVLDSRTTEQCVLGSTSFASIGPVRRLYRRRYEGDLIVIATAGGEQIRVTPRHPILTARGWCPAEEVEPGHDVVYSVAGNGLGVGAGEHVGVQPSFSEVADPLFEVAGSRVTKKGASAADFHGDGRSVDDEVDVLDIDGDLLAHLEAARAQLPRDKVLRLDRALAALRGSALTAEGGLPAVLGGRLPAVDPAELHGEAAEQRVDSGLGAAGAADDVGGTLAGAEPLDDRRGLGVGDLGVLASPEGGHGSVPLEEGRHEGRGGPELAPERRGGLPVPVAPQDVIGVWRELASSSHVYNATTDSSAYQAGGIVVHNCFTRDGKVYFIGEGPRPPAHFRCRSDVAPLTRSVEDIVAGKTDPPTMEDLLAAKDRRLGRRAAYDYSTGINRQVPIGMTFEQWLRTQPATIQDEVLGRDAARLWRTGKIRFESMLQNERVLTLTEVIRREGLTAADLRAAGIRAPGRYLPRAAG